MTSATCPPLPPSARCGPTACPAAPWPAPATSHRRSPPRPTWWWRDRREWWRCSPRWLASSPGEPNGPARPPWSRPERGELAAQPASGRVRGGGGGERGAAALALGVGHGQRPVQRLGRLGDV